MEHECGNCRFFQINEYEKGTGICRRYPPNIFVHYKDSETVDLARGWEEPLSFCCFNQPSVQDNFWCGEYQSLLP